MNRIVLGLGMIAVVAGLSIGASGAFFNDTEVSTGNTFTAGTLDLKVDNESYAIDYNIPGYDNPQGDLVASDNTSWSLDDLTIQKFFDFVDLKPGDFGEDTISLHVQNNAWICAAAQTYNDNDNDITEPEDEVFGTNTDQNDGTPDGDLDEAVNFVFWWDDGDNVLENCVDSQIDGCFDETQHIITGGPISGLGGVGQIALADSEGGVIGAGEPIPSESYFYIGKAWCFGDLGMTGVSQDGDGKTGLNGPTSERGPGVSCDGSNEGNIAQSDSIQGDLMFYAEQSRNNDNFLCSDWTPNWPIRVSEVD